MVGARGWGGQSSAVGVFGTGTRPRRLVFMSWGLLRGILGVLWTEAPVRGPEVLATGSIDLALLADGHSGRPLARSINHCTPLAGVRYRRSDRAGEAIAGGHGTGR